MGAMSEVMLRLATDAKIPTRERWDLGVCPKFS